MLFRSVAVSESVCALGKCGLHERANNRPACLFDGAYLHVSHLSAGPFKQPLWVR